MKSLRVIACLSFMIVAGCSDLIMNMRGKTNTVVVQNRSGMDIPKVVVLEGRTPHTFKDLDQTSDYGHMIHVRTPTTRPFTVTVSFPDGQCVTTNTNLSFDPNKLKDTCILIQSNRLIRIEQRAKNDTNYKHTDANKIGSEICKHIASITLPSANTFRSPTPEQSAKIREYLKDFPVLEETKWSVTYGKTETNQEAVITQQYVTFSKFMLGQVSISTEDLRKEWPNWSRNERSDFCMNVGYADTNVLPDIIRFIMKNGDQNTWSTIALLMVFQLPKTESIPFLTNLCAKTQLGMAGNFYQALAETKDPTGIPLIEHHLQMLLKDPHIQKVAGETDVNWIAYEAICCVELLLDLGQPKDKYQKEYRMFKKHPDQKTRKTAETFLSKYF